MPLVPPLLDDRRFDDLVAEARARITRFNPSWTDFNESDPGITLVQLFAWMTELMLFRINQVPQRNYIKFLQMLGLELSPAQPAVAQLVFTPDNAPDSPEISLPAGTRISAESPDGGPPTVFETEEGIDIVKRPLGSLQVFDGRFTEVGPINNAFERSFRPFGRDPRPGNAIYFGFDPSATQFAELKAAKAKEVTTRLRPFPSRIRIRINLPLPDAEGQPPSVSCDNEAGSLVAQPAPPPGVRLVWEYKPDDLQPWTRLTVDRDETAGFTREGVVQIAAPDWIVPTLSGQPTPPPPALIDALDSPDQPFPRFWLRCRLDAGSYPAGLAPLVAFVSINAMQARNLTTVRDEALGVSDGSPKQVYRLTRRPVLLDDLMAITVGPVDADGTLWTRRDDLLASGRNDTHVVVDANTGEVRFGDGRRGMIPPAGLAITAKSYRHGGGSAGNVGAGTLVTPARDLGPVLVTNPRPAVGGRDEQTLDDLIETAPARIRARDRAVTEADFQALAKTVGGVAKATCLPRVHPDFPDLDAPFPGAVTVVVVPEDETDTPSPSAALTREVCRVLNQHRLVGSEVFVTGPRYRAVKVRALVTSRPDLAPGVVEQSVVRALNEFLDPLGRAWPNLHPRRPANAVKISQNDSFGQDLNPSRLYAIIQSVPGVIAVPLLSVEVDGTPMADLSKPYNPGRDGLLYPSGHEIRVSPGSSR